MQNMGQQLELSLSGPIHDAIFYRAVNKPNPASGIHAIADLNTLKSIAGSNALIVLLDLPWVLIFLGALFLLHPTLGWTAVVCLLVLILLATLGQKLNSRRIESASQLSRQATAEVQGHVNSSEAVIAMGMMNRLRSEWTKDQIVAARAQHQVSRSLAGTGALSRTIRLVSQSGMLGLAAYLAINKEVSSGAIVASSILLSRAMQPADQFILRFGKSVRSYRRYSGLINSL